MHPDGITLVFLSRGRVALIDSADAPEVLKYKWHWDGAYPARNMRSRKKQRLHELLIPEADGVRDHINRDKLDNRRCNLRVVPQRVNAMNGPRRKNNTSGYHGVDHQGSRPEGQRWRARVGKKHIGRYATSEEAARAHDKAALEMFGEHVQLNFP